jgi:trehalose PTS system EIIBC or EIIBCA component
LRVNKELSKNYFNKIKDLTKFLGGKENIISHDFCVSRLRLILKNPALVDSKLIYEKLGINCIQQGTSGSFHIIIGLDVKEFYQQFLEFNQLSNNNSHEEDDHFSSDKLIINKKWYQNLFDNFSAIFSPLIPVLVAGGIILGIQSILKEIFINNDPNPDKKSFWKGLDEILQIPSQAIFWYIPVTICWSIFRKNKGTEALGIVLGLCLLMPPLQGIYNEEISEIYKNSNNPIDFLKKLLDNDNFTFNFGAFKFPWKIAYTGQVFPAIMIGFLGVYIERFFNKFISKILKQILVPLLTILITLFLSLFIIGPFGFLMGAFLSKGFTFILGHHILKYILGPIVGVLYAPVVITGIHSLFNTIMIQEIDTNKGSLFFPVLAISNIAQGASCLMIAYLYRKKDKKIYEIGIPSGITCLFGVTEPAMYGVNLIYFFPFLAAILSSGVGTFFLILFGISSNGIGSGGILGIISMQLTSKVEGITTFFGNGYLCFLITVILTIISAFSLTYLFSFLKIFQKKNPNQK